MFIVALPRRFQGFSMSRHVIARQTRWVQSLVGAGRHEAIAAGKAKGVPARKNGGIFRGAGKPDPSAARPVMLTMGKRRMAIGHGGVKHGLRFDSTGSN